MANLETTTTGMPVQETGSLATVSYLPAASNERPPQQTEDVFIYDGVNTITMEHGSVRVAGQDIKYSFAMPEERIYEGFAVTIPGYGGFKPTSRSFRQTLASAGVPTVTYGPARKDDYSTFERLTNSQELHTNTIEAIVDDIRDRSKPGEKTELERIWLIPHSMGNLAAADFAKKHSSQVEVITSLAGVGHGSPTLEQFLDPRFIPKAIMAIRHEIVPYLASGLLELHPVNAYRAFHYYTRNPLRTMGEAYACLSTDVRPAYERLGELGIKTTFLAFEHDCLIPANESIAENVGEYQVVKGAGHLAPLLKSARVVSHMLNAHGIKAV